MLIGILEPEDFSEKAIQKLNKIGDVQRYINGRRDQFVSDKEVLFVRLKHYIDNNLLKRARNLKYICTPTTGLIHIDQEEISKMGIEIISLKDESQFLQSIRATPEHAFGLTLALLRRYKEAFLNSRNSKWDRDRYKGYEVNNSHVGIIGFGRVGDLLARYFKAFNANVYYYDTDKKQKPRHGAIKMNSLNTLIQKAEIIILAASYDMNKQYILDRYKIDMMKDKYLINISRGELIEEKHLIKCIREGHFKGVALDVIDSENKRNNNLAALIKATNNNLIITPHIAGATYSSMHRTEEFIADKLIRKVRG